MAKKAKQAEEKREVGRPTEFNPIYCDQLLDHMKEGGSFQGFAGKIGFSKQTLYNWLDHFPEFVDAKERGEAAALYWWEEFGKNNLILYEGIKFNASVWNRNMENRFGWSKKVDNTHDHKISPHQLICDLIEEQKQIEAEQKKISSKGESKSEEKRKSIQKQAEQPKPHAKISRSSRKPS